MALGLPPCGGLLSIPLSYGGPESVSSGTLYMLWDAAYITDQDTQHDTSALRHSFALWRYPHPILPYKIRDPSRDIQLVVLLYATSSGHQAGFSCATSPTERNLHSDILTGNILPSTADNSVLCHYSHFWTSQV